MTDDRTLLLFVVLYFLAGVMAISLLSFTGTRSALTKVLARTGASLARVMWRVGDAGLALPLAMVQSLRAASVRAASVIARWVARHRWLALSFVLLVTVPMLVALALRERHVLDGYGDSAVERNEHVLALLKGESLVPPPALPPQVFTTREVEQVRPRLGEANRDWLRLDPEFRQRLLVVFRVMRERYGYEMVLIEGYRSPARQDVLAAMGSHVTQARAYQSLHQFGLAADAAFFRDGRLLIADEDAWTQRGYELYGHVAELSGLSWGGRWKMRDLSHVELRAAGIATQNK